MLGAMWGLFIRYHHVTGAYRPWAVGSTLCWLAAVLHNEQTRLGPFSQLHVQHFKGTLIAAHACLHQDAVCMSTPSLWSAWGIKDAPIHSAVLIRDQQPGTHCVIVGANPLQPPPSNTFSHLPKQYLPSVCSALEIRATQSHPPWKPLCNPNSAVTIAFPTWW